MIINFLGDSITEGVGASSYDKMYVQRVKEKTGFEVRNYGISGTRIAKQHSKTVECPSFDLDFQLRFPEMEDADFVFIFGGTNDWGHGDAIIGELDDNDPYTFCGGMNNLVKMVLNKYSRDKVCFLLPLHRDLEEGTRGDCNKPVSTAPLKTYVEIMKTILDKNNINYINLFEVGPKFEEIKDGHNFFADIVHPNDFGHEFLADTIVSYLKEHNIK